jgi:hypothetical protein
MYEQYTGADINFKILQCIYGYLYCAVISVYKWIYAN